jgi:hypothetical protein
MSCESARQSRMCSIAHRLMTNLHLGHNNAVHGGWERQYTLRQTYVELYGWSIPRGGLIRLIRRRAGNVGNVIIPIAGLGFVPFLLTSFVSRDGTYFPASRVIATDIEPHRDAYCTIRQEDGVVTAGNSTSLDTMVISWAPYASPLGVQMVRAFNGHTIIVIGEGRDGCTANNDFFDELATNWTQVQLNSDTLIYTWPTIHDEVTVYTRR